MAHQLQCPLCRKAGTGRPGLHPARKCVASERLLWVVVAKRRLGFRRLVGSVGPPGSRYPRRRRRSRGGRWIRIRQLRATGGGSVCATSGRDTVFPIKRVGGLARQRHDRDVTPPAKPSKTGLLCLATHNTSTWPHAAPQREGQIGTCSCQGRNVRRLPSGAQAGALMKIMVTQSPLLTRERKTGCLLV